ncbi:MAG: PilZ domain-containing protein [Pseudomonadota bacterium]
MFWKKKKPATDTIIHESEDKRTSYRYQFKDDQGIEIQFKTKKVRLLNISAGGMAFKNNGFEQFDYDFIKFTLDIPNFTGNNTFFAGLRILSISPEEICHCIFEQCSLDQHELIHRFVLEMQKK